MTDLDLSAIRARWEAATPGPWERVQPEFRDHTSQSVRSRAGSVVAFAGYGLTGSTAWANAEAIAHAPADIAALIDEVEKLRGEKADAWDEGYQAGRRDHCDYSPTDECDIASANPYREGKQ